MYDNNPFELLGLKPGADADAVRAAYRRMVKSCHPDQFQDAEEQRAAQERLIQLNLAYESALKFASRRTVGFNLISQEEAKHFAQRLIDQGNLESALRQLNRADSKDTEWYFIQGNILMALKQYETAHQSYREAVRREPDNRKYREGALDAALAMKKNRPLGEKVMSWLGRK
ncbi:MAG: DnaJ domain-containing protein [Clostridia bacterium]|nr:DnaJ domain-containing protein [Clostridia bacterium]